MIDVEALPQTSSDKKSSRIFFEAFKTSVSTSNTGSRIEIHTWQAW